jgi:D-amino-acid oxidase
MVGMSFSESSASSAPSAPPSRITVIGAGVIGLSCAHELADAGYDVTVVADHGTGDTVSAIAGGLWFPYRSEKSPVADRILERSLIRFIELAEEGEEAEAVDDTIEGVADDFTDDIAPVTMTRGMLRERLDPPDRDWIPPVTAVLGEDAVQEIPGGLETNLPMINSPKYLAWLMDACRVAGVAFVWQKVDSLESLQDSADAVVIAGGIRGGELLGGDDQINPVRGQIILMANGTGDTDEDGDSGEVVTDFIVDTDDVEAQTYVLPRGDDIIVGGVSEEGSWDETPNVETAEAILGRAEEMVPALATLPILGHGAGLRPQRPTLRLEHIAPGTDGVPDDLPVIAAYGHGGAGITLSWGTAERVVELVAELAV